MVELKEFLNEQNVIQFIRQSGLSYREILTAITEYKKKKEQPHIATVDVNQMGLFGEDLLD